MFRRRWILALELLAVMRPLRAPAPTFRVQNLKIHFTPTSLRIKAGDTAQWRNASPSPHEAHALVGGDRHREEGATSVILNRTSAASLLNAANPSRFYRVITPRRPLGRART
jgi:plastocyanin